MIDALRSDDIIRQVGGRFKLTTLVHKRLNELIQGSRPLIDRDGRSDLELAIAEIEAGLIYIDYEASNITDPEKSLS